MVVEMSVVERNVVSRGEDEVVGPRAGVATTQPVEHSSDRIAHRDAADPLRLRRAERTAGVAAPHVDEALGEVDVRPPQRPQLPHPQTGDAAVTKTAPNSSDPSARATAGLATIHPLRFARLRIPCSSTRIFWIGHRDKDRHYLA
jgi:hypothetical protein